MTTADVEATVEVLMTTVRNRLSNPEEGTLALAVALGRLIGTELTPDIHAKAIFATTMVIHDATMVASIDAK